MLHNLLLSPVKIYKSGANGVVESTTVFGSDASFETEGIILGDGANSDNDVRLVFFPDATLEISSGFVLNRNLLS